MSGRTARTTDRVAKRDVADGWRMMGGCARWQWTERRWWAVEGSGMYLALPAEFA